MRLRVAPLGMIDYIDGKKSVTHIGQCKVKERKGKERKGKERKGKERALDSQRVIVDVGHFAEKAAPLQLY
jgi:hypothetical protein